MRSLIQLFVFQLLMFLCPGLSAQEILVPRGSVWQYLDDGTDQGTAWQKLSYNDSDWNEGQAQLGYGDGDEVTVTGYGSDSLKKNITTYFRHTFSVSDTTGFKGLYLHLLKDDGAVVYLNEKEVVRCDYMPTYEIAYGTAAWATAEGDEETSYFHQYDVPLDSLLIGENILAVEVHQRGISDPDMSFDLELEMHQGKTFLKQPYLVLTGSDDQMRINWQMAYPDTCIVKWGLDSTLSLGTETTYEYTEDHLHQCTIQDLQAGTKYYYQVYSARDTSGGSFVSAPTTDTEKLSFLVYGDTRTHPGTHNMVADAMVEHVEQYPWFQTVLMHSGDIVDDGDLEEHWDEQFFTPAMTGFNKLIAMNPFIPTYGNHEESGVLLRKYFPLPWLADSGFYFSFDYGPAHFVVLDVYIDYYEGTDQYAWIAEDLASSDKKWKFILAHRCGWSNGVHPDLADVKDYIQPLCEEHGVQIFFAGHNHNYARANANGVLHLTTGGGGAPLYSPYSTKENVVYSFTDYHFTAISIDGDSLNLKAIGSEGEILDDHTISHIIVSADEVMEELYEQGKHALYQSYPNPFTRSTQLRYSLAYDTRVELSVYNLGGQKVATLVNQTQSPGNYEVTWEGDSDAGEELAPGIYICRMRAEDYMGSIKVTIAE
ncbi:MAG: metallophosphoesterase [Bacteroidota bacterium]